MLLFFYVLFLLLVGHALADYPLQGDFLAQAKNRNTPLGEKYWKHALFSHAMIHGGFVLLFTQSIVLAIAEVIIHGITDYFKCENKISFNIDQWIHISCKVVWALLAILVI